MKKKYTVPQSTVLKFYSEESVMLGASNTKGNGQQLSNKREFDDDNASDGSHIWNSSLWSYEGE